LCFGEGIVDGQLGATVTSAWSRVCESPSGGPIALTSQTLS